MDYNFRNRYPIPTSRPGQVEEALTSGKSEGDAAHVSAKSRTQASHQIGSIPRGSSSMAEPEAAITSEEKTLSDLDTSGRTGTKSADISETELPPILSPIVPAR